MSNNKANLIHECTRILKLSKKGSHLTRLNHIKVIRVIIEDLYSLHITPRYLSELQEKELKRLIDFWISKNHKPETVANKVGVIRKIFTLTGVKDKLPTNKKLGIKISDNKTRQFKSITTETLLEKIEHPLTKTIVDFEVNFGLTKTESIKLSLYSIADDHITIYRDISYNHKDRIIPIISSKQQNVIDSRKQILQKFNCGEDKESLLDISTFESLSTLYRVDMAILGIEGHSHFRDIYMKNRFLELSGLHSSDDAQKILMSELGLSSRRLLTGLINE